MGIENVAFLVCFLQGTWMKSMRQLAPCWSFLGYKWSLYIGKCAKRDRSLELVVRSFAAVKVAIGSLLRCNPQ